MILIPQKEVMTKSVSKYKYIDDKGLEIGSMTFWQTPLRPSYNSYLDLAYRMLQEPHVWQGFLDIQQPGQRYGVPLWSKSIAQLLYDRKLKESYFFTVDASDNNWTTKHIGDVQQNLVKFFGLRINQFISGVNDYGSHWWFWGTQGQVRSCDLSNAWGN